jgi:hypothetical protein
MIMATASGFAYAGVILTLFCHCTPMEKNWQVKPYAGGLSSIRIHSPQLTIHRQMHIDSHQLYCRCCSEGLVSIPSFPPLAHIDIARTVAGILAIALPLIWEVKIPLRHKLIIGLFLSGIFVITPTLLRCILTLAQANQIGNSTIWSIRETFVSLIAISAPAIKPLFNKNNWTGSSNHPKSGSTGPFKKFGGGRSRSVKELSIAGARKSSVDMGDDDLETARSWKAAESLEQR